MPVNVFFFTDVVLARQSKLIYITPFIPELQSVCRKTMTPSFASYVVVSNVRPMSRLAEPDRLTTDCTSPSVASVLSSATANVQTRRLVTRRV